MNQDSPRIAELKSMIGAERKRLQDIEAQRAECFSHISALSVMLREQMRNEYLRSQALQEEGAQC